MRKLLCALLILPAISLFSQNTVSIKVRDALTQEPLPGAAILVEGFNIGGQTDSAGLLILKGVPAGAQTLQCRYLGYRTQQRSATFPLAKNVQIVFSLYEAEEELGEVVIRSTRSSRAIARIPSRVEVITLEELEEKINMKPGDVRMLLNESTGIQTQQTSATSANASIRIQGLDGRYTQLLRDGLPMYSGLSSGLGLLQILPLDLKQVEVIKGSTSTLYGGGAIAGLVNFITRQPEEKPLTRLLANVSSAGGLDLSAFTSRKLDDDVGFTLLASRNSGASYDPADVGFSAIPRFNRLSINPRFWFYFQENTTIQAGFNYSVENRLGGDMKYVQGRAQWGYFERNKSNRFATQLQIDHKFSKRLQFSLRNSIGRFNRDLSQPQYRFKGAQLNSFSELHARLRPDNDRELIAGINYVNEHFEEGTLQTRRNPLPPRNYNLRNFGTFAQYTWSPNEQYTLEAGLRTDLIQQYGAAVLPRLAVLYKMTKDFSARINIGLGYKAPTLFTEESEALAYRGIALPDADALRLERSFGVNFDFNYQGSFELPFLDEEITYSWNQLFFYTQLNHPLILETQNQSSPYHFINLEGNYTTRGIETNFKFSYQEPWKLFVGYTLTDAKRKDGGTSIQLPLTPKHRINTVLMYELEDQWRFGLEAYYFSPQRLSGEDARSRAYWICGFMAEKSWDKYSFFLNFENFLDARQTRYGAIYSGFPNNPLFKEIYAPMDGFVVNAGVKITFE
ncbi:TonB-dependent receptor domain-containing protein [Haliscomenobacter sp.]|uniref:TonB-dependent receptor n=1 Tax=Haliscomenobacter sp. TaxID=2717303 RepID=UPI00359466E5